jgi:Ca2+-binding RTX toxin-like protein
MLINGNNNNTLIGTNNADDIFGLGGNDILLGRDGDDSLDGGEGRDRLDGGDGRDTLDGGIGIGNDILQGGDNSDLLLVGDGNDTLTGGSGRDVFKFNELDPAVIRPTITDFDVTDDVIQFNRAQFQVLKPGATALSLLPPGDLAARRFNIGAGPADRNDYFTYNDVTGALLFDRDGIKSGPGFPTTQIAQLAPGLNPTNINFVMV